MSAFSMVKRLPCLIAVTSAAAVLSHVPGGSGVAADAGSRTGTSIVVAGQGFEVGRPVVLWRDPQGFDGYQERCIDQRGGCCDGDSRRYGDAQGGRAAIAGPDAAGGLAAGAALRRLRQLALLLQVDAQPPATERRRLRPVGALHDRRRRHHLPDPRSGGARLPRRGGQLRSRSGSRSATAAASTATSGRSCRSSTARGRSGRWSSTAASHEAYDFRPEQYDSIVALTRTLLRMFPRIKPIIPERDGQPLLETLADPLAFEGILGHLHVDLQQPEVGSGRARLGPDPARAERLRVPVQIRSFTELPRTQRELLGARRAAFFNAEERASGFFPITAGRFWHSGVHLRGDRRRAGPRAHARANHRGPARGDGVRRRRRSCSSATSWTSTAPR